MKKALLAAAALLAFPVATFAATYHYVDTSGTVRTVQASSADEAMNRATDIAPHSGVALDTGVLDSGDSVIAPGIPNTGGSVNADMYHYVDMYGVVRSVEASTPAEALLDATNIAAHSGVAVDTGTLDDGVSVVNQ